MKFTSVIFTALILFILFNLSLQQRRARGPTGRRFSTGSRDSSLKGVQLAEQMQVDQAERDENFRAARYYDSNDCNDIDEGLRKDFVNLALVGNNGIVISQPDFDQYDYCDHAKRSLKSYLSHVDCLRGKVRDELTTLGVGFKSWINKRCTSKSYYDKFTAFTKCYRKEDVHDEWQHCLDKVVEAQKYIFKNVPAKNQLDALCCYMPHAERCLRNRTDVVCGPRIADNSIEIVWGPWDESLENWCTGKYDCSKIQLSTVQSFNKIFATDAPVTKPGVLYTNFVKMLKNTYGEDY